MSTRYAHTEHLMDLLVSRQQMYDLLPLLQSVRALHTYLVWSPTRQAQIVNGLLSESQYVFDDARRHDLFGKDPDELDAFRKFEEEVKANAVSVDLEPVQDTEDAAEPEAVPLHQRLLQKMTGAADTSAASIRSGYQGAKHVSGFLFSQAAEKGGQAIAKVVGVAANLTATSKQTPSQPPTKPRPQNSCAMRERTGDSPVHDAPIPKTIHHHSCVTCQREATRRGGGALDHPEQFKAKL